MKEVTLMCLVIILATALYLLGVIHGYRQGQIDAVTDKMYYCLEKQDNNEFTWEYHLEGCNGVERKD